MAEQKHLCYNCFQAREVLEGPCPYCGFDLAENEKKFPVALRAGTVLNGRYIIGRVLGQGGNLTGYAGGLDKKIGLLTLEGAEPKGPRLHGKR